MFWIIPSKDNGIFLYLPGRGCGKSLWRWKKKFTLLTLFFLFEIEVWLQFANLEAMEETKDPPIRIMKFVSEEQVNHHSKSQALLQSRIHDLCMIIEVFISNY